MKRAILVGLLAWSALGCEGQKHGDPCDGFFSNGCKGPMTCLTDDKGKYCSQSCSINKAFPEMSTPCPQGSECVEVGVSKGSASLGSMGTMCTRPK
jgi:hypothetical protein